jgi:phosphodiesterase/alkaline phosphatase D-like protein
VDDKWCGRPFRRQRDEIIDFIEDQAIERVVFLVGDMHCAYHASLSIGNGHRWMRRTIHELAGGPINQLDLSGRAQFTDASLITRGDQNPYQVRMHQFHGNASAVMHVEVTNARDPHDPDTEVPEIVWRVIRTMTDPESKCDGSNGLMRIEDPAPISGRITFCKSRGLDDLPDWQKEDP